ncbi:MYND-type domain-containing protein [Mycena sanguinolenta]|uniref:MYND-type domain-containing protein n=1 Tax=Mycena sanguinolenta TaxID=230812 RepID=A0A8H7D785_9AGAR|nr:MYND-type domain-containing protein [Mycena sanguinolenta]
MIAREEILGLLRSMGIELPPKTKLSDAELDKRLSKALDSAQFLTRVVPAPPFDPTIYPPWFRTQSPKPVLEAIRRNNFAEATLVEMSQRRGIDNPFPLYTNAFMDLRQTLMTIGNACDRGMVPLVLQDKEQSSGICMRVLDVRQFDDRTPIVIVVFHHDLEDALSRGSFDWISSYVTGSAGHSASAMLNVTATVQEQLLLLRLLNQNKKRLVSSYKPKRASTESSFTLSFLLPVGPLGEEEIVKYNTNNGCSVCGEPAKQKCSRCSAVRYCDAVCQKEDWKIHRPLCNSLQGGKWQGLTFVPVDRPSAGLYGLRVNKYDTVADLQKRLDRMKEGVEPGPPPNTHGTTAFIVKVQVNSASAKGPAHSLFPSDPSQDGSFLFIYDQRRTIDVSVPRESVDAASFDAVRDVLREKGERGIKGFFWAIRTGEWALDICLDRFPEWQKW